MAIEQSDVIFTKLYETITRQAELIESISNKLQQIESIGGGGGGGTGNATISDYQTGQNYVRNTLVVDTDTETVYRVLEEYTSVSVEQDCANGKLKLVGYEGQFVAFNHNPTQMEINQLPDDALVAIYNSTTTPYHPDN